MKYSLKEITCEQNVSRFAQCKITVGLRILNRDFDNFVNICKLFSKIKQLWKFSGLTRSN